MLKKSTLLVASTLGLVGLGASMVQAAPAATTDKKYEITLAGTATNDKDFNNGSIQASGTFGYYFSDQLEVNLRQSGGYSDLTSGGKSAWYGSTGIGLDYHFDMGQDQRIVPFVGATVGYRYGDIDDSITAAPEAGVKFYVNDTTFIFGEVSYDFLLKESFGDGSFNYALGVGFRF